MYFDEFYRCLYHVITTIIQIHNISNTAKRSLLLLYSHPSLPPDPNPWPSERAPHPAPPNVTILEK